ncbi:MAG: hypothetical protein Q7S02_05510 [bacterium]|nr:hypothetical protein [bacterium]
MHAVAQETLPVLLVLYPLLLLLDDLEPGFVRSAVNPHAFLLVLLLAGMLAGNESSVRRSRRAPVAVAIGAAIIGGVWIWWKLHTGTLGIVAGLLTAIAITLCASSFAAEPDSSDRISSDTSSPHTKT